MALVVGSTSIIPGFRRTDDDAYLTKLVGTVNACAALAPIKAQTTNPPMNGKYENNLFNWLVSRKERMRRLCLSHLKNQELKIDIKD